MLEVSRSGYYRWLKSRDNALKRKLEEERVLELIKKHYTLNREVYGLYRIHKAIGSIEGIRVNRKRIHRIMKKYGIHSKAVRNFRVTTTPDGKGDYSPNLIEGNFSVQSENELWTGDITYIWTKEGWIYLSVVLDAFNREVIGWAMNVRLNKEIVVDAFNMALINRRSSLELITKPVIFHSDRGSQYSSTLMRHRLREAGFSQSMSSRGNCYDNAITETFFSSLKKELVYLTRFETRDVAKRMLFDYMEIFYNRKRLHSALNYLSPVDYRIAVRKEINSRVA